MVRLVNELIDEFDVTVVALRGGEQTLVADLHEDVDVVDLDITGARRVHRLGRLWRELRQTDVLLCSLYHAAVLGNPLGWVARVDTTLTWQHNEEFRSTLRRWLFGRITRMSDGILADSETVAEVVAERLPIPSERIHIVPIAGVDTAEFTPAEREERDEVLVGILGRLVEQKNHDAVLTVADALRDEPIRFEIAGDGPRRDELEAQVDAMGLEKVRFQGFVDDVPAFLQGLDIYVQPSHHEGLCITVLEAMACGLPVVGTAVGGLNETVLDGETGYLIEPGDEDALVQRIHELHGDSDLRVAMGRRGRERVVEEYSQTVLVQRFLSVLKEARSA